MSSLADVKIQSRLEARMDQIRRVCEEHGRTAPRLLTIITSSRPDGVDSMDESRTRVSRVLGVVSDFRVFGSEQ